MDQDAQGGISELSVGLNVLGVDEFNCKIGVLEPLSKIFGSTQKLKKKKTST